MAEKSGQQTNGRGTKTGEGGVPLQKKWRSGQSEGQISDYTSFYEAGLMRSTTMPKCSFGAGWLRNATM
jgi:hypothetical protein